jgi:acyl dehydratase
MDRAGAFPNYDDIAIGFELPTLENPLITRQTLAIYCGASGDHNPVHVDIDFARASGLDDVIAHGMLIMAYSGRVLTQWVTQTAIRSFDTRFLSPTHIGDAITARASVVEKFIAEDGARCLRLAISTTDQHGEAKTSGSAVIALS